MNTINAAKLHQLFVYNDINYSDVDSIEKLLFICALANKNHLFISFNYHFDKKLESPTLESLKPFKEAYDLCMKLLEEGFAITILTRPCGEYKNGELHFTHYQLKIKISF